MYAHLSPSFPSFLCPSFLCHLSRREGRGLYGSYLCWTGAARASAKQSAWTGASWQGSLTDASWCLNPLSACQRQKFGWLSVTFQLPPESKAQWQSRTSMYVMAFCFPLRILILFSFILWFSFPPSQPCSSAIQLLCYECPKFLLAISFIPKKSEVAQSCPTLCYPVDCSLPGSSIHGILQARILEWVAISFSRGSSQPRDQTQVSCIAGRCFNLWATREKAFKITLLLYIEIITLKFQTLKDRVLI